MHRPWTRVKAAQATLDHFNNKPFEWGKYDCARLAAYAASRMGHRPGLLKFGSYSTETGAARALLRQGHRTLVEAINGMGLAQIAPASAWVGDVMSLDADTPLGALVVCLGNGRVLGFHESTGTCVVMQPVKFDVAWRL